MQSLLLEDPDGDTLEVEKFLPDNTHHLLVTIYATHPSSVALDPAQVQQLIETCEEWLRTKDFDR